MEDGRPHPLLAQIPLTVSPFISLPTATTLPYTYRSLPSTLPPSSTGEDTNNQKSRYVVSKSGHAAHPDDIIASCQALQARLRKMQEDAELTLQRWRDDIDQRTLAEKRRIAPGWLDRDEKILEPEKMRNSSTAEQDLVSDGMTGVETGADGGNDHAAPYSREEAEQLDRFFGGMKI